MNNRFGILYDSRYFCHTIAAKSLENPDRIKGLYERVQQNYRDNYVQLVPREATMTELERVHSGFYIDQIREHSASSNPYSYDPDTYLMEESLSTAALAAGGCLSLADEIMSGNLDFGYGLIRPPGHHAEPGRGMGFCIVNNIGVTAKYLLDNYQLNRILVLDFDVHHGNGTQEMFYDSKEVLFVSIHQRDLFPGTGEAGETGAEDGQGYTVNVPVHAQFGDQEYTYLMGRLLQGIVEQYMPQIILVSAGYDGHADDTISSTNLSTEWFGTIATMLKQYAEDTCDGRLLFILEGGYNPKSLEASVVSTLDHLLTPQSKRVGVLYSERADLILQHHPLKKFWNIM